MGPRDSDNWKLAESPGRPVALVKESEGGGRSEELHLRSRGTSARRKELLPERHGEDEIEAEYGIIPRPERDQKEVMPNKRPLRAATQEPNDVAPETTSVLIGKLGLRASRPRQLIGR